MSKDDLLFWRLFAVVQVFPEIPPPDVLTWLTRGGREYDETIGLAHLQSLSLEELEATFPGDSATITLNRWQSLMSCLQGELPPHLTLTENRRQPQQLRVAFSSLDGITVNGHFGQSHLFFIYAFDSDGPYLMALRRTPASQDGEESNETRARLINDCHLLFCEAIGGPAAARIIRHNIHPVKVVPGVSIESQLAALQNMLTGNMPPWLARRLGKINPLENRLFS
ncbi:nitrogen fixation protein NifY [Rahnella sp. AA]|uniref:NifB/NifX family molybdenum-iron cluster-binding protein n=1 Tax=Rahnella sp. AA TaxID=2057180 RepID=UPI000C33CED7|nr:NifB/NifX family molybdenum-iron cluster-binding protein [Rahnella sp. AA]PKE30838.1 nitrogen fixation protein NifY [Rahnella sp. AA]